MKDKRLLYLLGAGTLTGLAGTAGAQQQRPNIIYMMADQLRADVLGYAGDGLAGSRVSRSISPMPCRSARSAPPTGRA